MCLCDQRLSTPLLAKQYSRKNIFGDNNSSSISATLAEQTRIRKDRSKKRGRRTKSQRRRRLNEKLDQNALRDSNRVSYLPSPTEELSCPMENTDPCSSSTAVPYNMTPSMTDPADPVVDESLIFQHSDTIKENKFPSGRVICDMESVLNQARQLENHTIQCNFSGKMIFSKVTCFGLLHTYHFICNQKLCGHAEKIHTDREKKSLNQLAVLGAMSVGEGFSQQEQLFSTMNMSYISRNTYSNCEKIAGSVISAHSEEKLDDIFVCVLCIFFSAILQCRHSSYDISNVTL